MSGANLSHERRRVRAALSAALVAVAPITGCSAATEAREADASVPADAKDDRSLIDASVDSDCTAAHNQGCGGRFIPDAGYRNAADAEICPLLFPCGISSGYLLSGCEVINPDGSPYGCRVVDDAGCVDGAYAPNACGTVIVDCRCDVFPGGGRRTRGARAARISAGDPVRAFFARMAAEEAASIDAFRRLRRELAHHGAPAELVADAARSERDERRHARVVGRLAGAPAHARGASFRARSLEAMAIENEIEGCVRETYGALLAKWQAVNARDAGTRAALARIAADEARHAGLAWAVSAWAREKLGARANARLDRARRRAARALARELDRDAPLAVVREAGVPTATQAAALLDALSRALVNPRSRTP
jgi:hypothetical protein